MATMNLNLTISLDAAKIVAEMGRVACGNPAEQPIPTAILSRWQRVLPNFGQEPPTASGTVYVTTYTATSAARAGRLASSSGSFARRATGQPFHGSGRLAARAATSHPTFGTLSERSNGMNGKADSKRYGSHRQHAGHDYLSDDRRDDQTRTGGRKQSLPTGTASALTSGK